MGAQLGNDDGLLSEINVTPLVDVMLVLLIVFMVTAPMLVAGIQVELPRGGTAVKDSELEILDLALDADGILYLDEKPLHVDLLEERLTALAAEGGIGIRVKADSSIEYGRVVEVLEVVRLSGIVNVGLITQPNPAREGRDRRRK